MSAPPLVARVPVGAGWEHAGTVPLPGGARGSVWRRGQVSVVSSLDMSKLPDGSGEIGPQWHVSVTTRGKRPKANHLALALRAFGMTGSEEDNHHPGEARHFFLVVDPKRRVDCDCKATEETLVEADGYRWTNPKAETGEECRGCEWARTFKDKPCPIHGSGTPEDETT